MKKVLSIVLSLVMLLSVGIATIPAFAATVGSIEETTVKNKVTVQVNGKTTTDITYERDPQNPKKITFTYEGDGKLKGWEFPGMAEGTDYEIISQKGNSITIEVSPDYSGDVIANAIVDEGSEKTTKKNGSTTSPKTGAAAAAGVAAMGAGAAILTALKKKED